MMGRWGEDDQLHVGKCRLTVSDVATYISNIIYCTMQKINIRLYIV